MNLAQLACPLCGGAFQVELTWQGHQVTCPHCGQVVTVPNLDSLAPPDFVAPSPPAEQTNRGPDSLAPPDFVTPSPPAEQTNRGPGSLAPPDFVTPSPPAEQTNRGPGSLAPPDFVAPSPPAEQTNRGRDSLAPPDFVTPSPPAEQTNRVTGEHPVELPPQTRMDEQQSADTPKPSRSETTAAVDNYILSRRAPAASPGGSPFAIHEAPKQLVDRQGHVVELKSRTPDQKARFRRRLHATVAIAGAAVLAVLLGSLLLL